VKAHIIMMTRSIEGEVDLDISIIILLMCSRYEPTDILIDTTIFSPRDIDKAGGFPDEEEVILLPRPVPESYAVREV
jgi:hypothetical protein